MNARNLNLPLLATAAVLTACSEGADDNAVNDNLYRVVREDLPLTVKENAELEAIRETDVRSQVEGNSTILYLIEEGTTVTEGQKLFELDVTQIVDRRATQEISVEKARSAWEQARTQQDILEKELLTKRNTAASQLTISEMELEKFLGAPAAQDSTGRNADMVGRLRDLINLPVDPVKPNETGDGKPQPTGASVTKVDPGNYKSLVAKVVALLDVDDGSDPLQREMGEMANKILQQADQIRIAMAQLKVTEDTVEHSRRLASKQFITRTDLERHELDFQSQESKVTIAWKDLELLINYTLPTELIQLTQNLDNARLELERVEASNDAERKKSAFDVDAKNKEYTVAEEQLRNYERQIENAICYAPTPGIVVYARLNRDRRSSEAVAEGVSVRERQRIILLPDNTRMRCVVKVQEAQVDRVAIGQPAHITVEAFQNKIFTGRVTRVAPVADSGSSWGGTDKKVYTTVVELIEENTDGQLRSRMAAGVTITVGNVKAALTVPQQAVRRDRSVNYVWKQTSSGPVATAVKVGAHNQEKVEILEGVSEGDVVYRTPPRGAPEPKFEQPQLPAGANIPSLPEETADDNKTTADNAAGQRTPPTNGYPSQRGGDSRGRGRTQKKLAEMSAEELSEYRERLDRMEGMASRYGDTDAGKQFKATMTKLKRALDDKDIATAQCYSDSLRATMTSMFSQRGGGRSGRDG